MKIYISLITFLFVIIDGVVPETTLPPKCKFECVSLSSYKFPANGVEQHCPENTYCNHACTEEDDKMIPVCAKNIAKFCDIKCPERNVAVMRDYKFTCLDGFRCNSWTNRKTCDPCVADCGEVAHTCFNETVALIGNTEAKCDPGWKCNIDDKPPCQPCIKE